MICTGDFPGFGSGRRWSDGRGSWDLDLDTHITTHTKKIGGGEGKGFCEWGDDQHLLCEGVAVWEDFGWCKGKGGITR